MTLLTEPTRIVLAKGYSLPDDADAVAYIAAVEAADGQALETATRMAINSFVKGCKADGIWPAIKASCIMAGARTLGWCIGAVEGYSTYELRSFVSGDYDRKTGLVGDGSTKYLDSNRADNAGPQNDAHMSVFVANAGSTNTNRAYISSPFNSPNQLSDIIARNDNWITLRLRNSNGDSFNEVPSPAGSTVNFIGVNRSASTSFTFRRNQSNTLVSSGLSAPSYAPLAGSVAVFVRPGSFIAYADARLAFYSIGESLDLALLDARVTDLINAFAATIP